MHLIGGGAGLPVGRSVGIRSTGCRWVAPRCSPRCYGGTWIPASAGMAVDTMGVQVGQGVGSGRDAGQDYREQPAHAGRQGLRWRWARHSDGDDPAHARRGGEGSAITRCSQGGTQTVMTRRPGRGGQGYVSTRCP